MILEHVGDLDEPVETAPPSGIWRLEPGGTVTFQRTGFSPQSIADKNEVFLLRTIDRGLTRTPGTCIGR